jgi:hypothetical protein
MRLRVRTFGCRHVTCAHRLFTARLPRFATPYARNTMRLVNALQAMGLALGGQAGARRHGPQAPLWGSGEHERFCLEKLLAAAITLIF